MKEQSMRSRGTYRHIPEVTRPGLRGRRPMVQVVDDDSDVEMIEIDVDVVEEKPFTCKKLKTDPKLLPKPNPNSSPVDVITIESEDEDFEEMTVLTNDSDYSSTSISTTEIIEEEVGPPVSLALSTQKCSNCRRPLSDDDYNYDKLTSADFYLNPRAHPSVIPLELRDNVRFSAFSEAIRHNKELFKNKVVMIVGSANGFLALLLGQGHPSTVIVYDRPGISQIVETVIEKNRLKLPNKKTKFFVVRDTIDHMVLPNGLKKVDIIVSDWTNHSLFFRSMVNCFIKARDKFLRKGGLIFPDKASLYLAAAHDNVHKHTAKSKIHSESLYVKRVQYWDKNIYGFDMRAIQNRVLSEPVHEYINRSQVVTNEFLLKSFDLYRMTLKDTNFSVPFLLSATKNHYLQTFVLFFDVIFTRSYESDMYSTRPPSLKTMFRPTIFLLDFEKHIVLEKDDQIKGRFKYALNEELSHLSVGIDFELKNKYFDANEKLVYSSD